MAFTAGSVELAHAQKLAAQLSAVYQSYGNSQSVIGLTLAQSGITATCGLADSYANRLGFRVTGFTTGAGFPPFGTKWLDGLSHGTDGTAATGTTLGMNYGLTLGIYLNKFVRADRPYAGTTFESYSKNTVVHAGFTAAIFYGGVPGSTGTVS